MNEHASKASSSAYETIYSLIGHTMYSETLHTGLKALFGMNLPSPELKVYSDCVYVNYHTVGTSFLFAPESGYCPKASSLDGDKLRLKSIDIYNHQTDDSVKKHPFMTFSLLPLSFPTPNGTVFDISDSTMGKEMVEALGEPPRKGGGDGPSSGSIDIWCEWPGFMVEFRQRGPQAWERGKDATWKVITLFSRKELGN